MPARRMILLLQQGWDRDIRGLRQSGYRHSMGEIVRKRAGPSVQDPDPLIDPLESFLGDQQFGFVIRKGFGLQIRMMSKDPDMTHFMSDNRPFFFVGEASQEGSIDFEEVGAAVGCERANRGESLIVRHDCNLDLGRNAKPIAEFGGQHREFLSLHRLSWHSDESRKPSTEQPERERGEIAHAASYDLLVSESLRVL